ncbi:membrane lipoprotein [Halorhabdus tiamatea SARL4B]|uniref:Membrane lipoprotein n=1 Tax=Halorhabdus tiamatea SARL4B TaxID=1033806 RepID=U2E0C9_9EURY|nr:membrane lipoprotein [Halorhabdus tiamatea SARL4B]
MNRRQFLTTIGSGTGISLAGCISFANTPTNPSGDGSFQRRSVSIISRDEIPDDVSASLSVDAISDVAAPDKMVKFQFTLTNRYDNVRSFDVGSIPVPNLLIGKSDPPHYVLLQPSHWTADDRRANCWESNAPDKDPYRVVPEERQVDLEPSESHSGDAALWGSVEDDVCWPTGKYRFRNDVSLDGTIFTWGFRFEVAKQ